MTTRSPSAKSRWGSMGPVVRRASSILVATHSTTPSIASSEREPDASPIMAKREGTGSVEGRRSQKSIKEEADSELQSIEYQHGSDSSSLGRIKTAPADHYPASSTSQHSTISSLMAEPPTRNAIAFSEDPRYASISFPPSVQDSLALRTSGPVTEFSGREAEREAALKAEWEATLKAEREAVLESEREAKREVERAAHEIELEAEREIALEAERVVREAELEAELEFKREAERVAREAELETEREVEREIEREIGRAAREAELEAEREAERAAREDEIEAEREARREVERLVLRSGSPEHPSPYPKPQASPSPASEVSMSCGMLPSSPDSLGPGTSRRREPSLQRIEQGKLGSRESWPQVGYLTPFSFDSHLNNSHQRDPRKSSDRVYNTTHDFGTSEVPLHISPPSSTSSGYDSHLQSPANPRRSTIAPPTKPLLLRDDRPLRAHGWVEYLLPDENLYYVHRTYQVVTDVDLGDERLLDAVTAYLEDHDDTLTPGQELWLRDMGFREREFAPLRYLVDHEAQSVTLDPLHQADLDGNSESHRTRRGYRDDRLDAKYQYWSFMETHPAHIPLPLGAHKDAIGALNWASTDGLLPSHHSAPAPFTRDECQSLTALLQSIDKRGDSMPLRTRTVSKILLRIVHWRQSQSRRPDMLLPVVPNRGNSLRRRDHYLPVRSGTFMFTTGAYACLAAAISLSPPRSFVRTASIGIGAILFLLSPMISNLVAVAPSGADSRSIVPYGRRDAFAIPDHVTTASRLPAPPLWHVWLWQGLGSRLYRVLISEPSNVVPTAVADSL